MENYYEDEMNTLIKNNLVIVSELEVIYAKLINFDYMFETDTIGKTKLKKDIFVNMNISIDKNLALLDSSLRGMLNKVVSDLSSLHQGMHLDVNTISDGVLNSKINLVSNNNIQGSGSVDIVQKHSDLLFLKNNLLNCIYFLIRLDTGYVRKLLHDIEAKILIDSEVVLNFIDVLALKNFELKKLKKKLVKFYEHNITATKLVVINDIITLLSREASSYKYKNNLYNIEVEYDNSFKKLSSVNYDFFMIENIVANFIEQSCFDLVHKDIHNIDKERIINIKVSTKNNSVEIVCQNFGHDSHLEEANSMYIVQAKNLASLLGTTIQASFSNSNGNIYSISLKLS